MFSVVKNLILHSYCNQILFKPLLNILYNLFKIRKEKTPCTAVYYINIYVATFYIIGDIFDLNLHLYHVFGMLTKKRWMKREREIRTRIAMVKDPFAKRKLLLTGGSDRTKKRIMKIPGVEYAIVWCENTDLYILNILDVHVFGM